MENNCTGCVYWAKTTKSCDYIFVEDRMRPCPPGDACTVRLTPKEVRMSKATWDTRKAQSMWLAGYSDKDIAQEVGTTAASVSYYRRKHWVDDTPRKENGSLKSAILLRP